MAMIHYYVILLPEMSLTRFGILLDTSALSAIPLRHLLFSTGIPFTRQSSLLTTRAAMHNSFLRFRCPHWLRTPLRSCLRLSGYRFWLSRSLLIEDLEWVAAAEVKSVLITQLQ